MREVRYILCCCVVFALTMLSGLTIHSCRTVKKTTHTSISTSDVNVERKDSSYLAALFEKWSRDWNLEIKYYEPVVDTSGLVIGQTLKKEVKASAQEKKESEKKEATQTESLKHDSIFVDRHEDESMRRSPPGVNLRFLCFTVIILGFIYLFVHNKKR